MESDVGLVNGYKLERQDPGHRVAIGFLYNRFARWLFGVRIRDIDCDYRLIRRVALNDAQLQSSSGTICVELVRMIELSPWRVVETRRPSLSPAARTFAVLSHPLAADYAFAVDGTVLANCVARASRRAATAGGMTLDGRREPQAKWPRSMEERIYPSHSLRLCKCYQVRGQNALPCLGY